MWFARLIGIVPLGIGLTVLACTTPSQRAVPAYSNMTFGRPEASMTNMP